MTTGLLSVPLGAGHRLNTAALPLLLIGILAALSSLYALATRRYLLARATAILTGAAIIWGWLIAGAAVLIAVLPAFLLYSLFADPTPEMTQ